MTTTSLEQGEPMDEERDELNPVAVDSRAPALLRELQSYLTEAICVVDTKGQILAALGPPQGVLGVGDGVGTHIFDYCHPDDLPVSLEAAIEAFGTAPGWHGAWTTRLRHVSGEWRVYELEVVNRMDDPVVAGFVLRIRELAERLAPTPPPLGIGHGIELDSLAETLPIPVLFFGGNNLARFANLAARRLLGEHYALVEVGGIAAVAAPDERAEVTQVLAKLHDDPGDATITVHLDPTGTARDRPILEIHLSSRRRDGVHALVATLVDVTDRHNVESELRRQASCDPLTGLLNRREAEAVLRERVRHDPDCVALIYCDLDGFKQVNDTFGHDVGDVVLVDVAKALRTNTRPVDLVARIGGDEFVVIVDNASDRDVPALAERISLAVRMGANYGVSASLGIAYAEIGDSPRTVIRRADRAMYASKRRREILANP